MSNYDTTEEYIYISLYIYILTYIYTVHTVLYIIMCMYLLVYMYVGVYMIHNTVADVGGALGVGLNNLIILCTMYR